MPISELIVGHRDPIAVAAEITAGYHCVTLLEDDELRLIFDLAATRCAMSVAVARWRVGDHPESAAYITDYVDRLTAILPGDLSVCMFACSGSEAGSSAPPVTAPWHVRRGSLRDIR